MGVDTDRQLVERFWEVMARNDFQAAGELLHDDYELEWPQSGERIRGRENFVAVNQHYPAAGPWHFTVHRIVAGDNSVVSDVTVTDSEVVGRAITFTEVRDGRIWRQLEFWPDQFEPAEWRSAWVEIAPE